MVPLEVEVASPRDLQSTSLAAPESKGPPPRVTGSVQGDVAAEPAVPEAGRSTAMPLASAPPEPPAARAERAVQVASLPPSRDASGRLMIPFSLGETLIPDAAYQELRSVARALIGQPDLRVQILAFARPGEEIDGSARRTSLSRALAVRSYLIDAGIRSTRIDVRALGDRSDGGPKDRVEVVLSQS